MIDRPGYYEAGTRFNFRKLKFEKYWRFLGLLNRTGTSNCFTYIN
jgi:hypothetical protein